MMTGTPLYHRVIAFDYGDRERNELMQKVWSGTPWMIDIEIGSPNSDHCRKIVDWCHEQFGNEAWPIHGRPGRWQRGRATINGWNWFGFSTEAEMNAFRAKWGGGERP